MNNKSNSNNKIVVLNFLRVEKSNRDLGIRADLKQFTIVNIDVRSITVLGVRCYAASSPGSIDCCYPSTNIYSLSPKLIP